jgi:protein dithiol oxidoreductase (disulfide-forming)
MEFQMMHRREFSQALGASALSLSLLPAAYAQNRAPEDGADYISLDKPVPTEPKGKVEVIEFFWYSCPHCNHFEPTLQAWLQKAPKDVVFKRMPVAFRDSFIPQQRLYYALETLGKVDALHKAVFHAIHTEKQTLDTADQIIAWAVKQGLDKKQFTDAFNSFSTGGKIGRAKQLQDQYKVSGVPALAVGGRYYTDGSLAKNMTRALTVVDHLIDQVRRG